MKAQPRRRTYMTANDEQAILKIIKGTHSPSNIEFDPTPHHDSQEDLYELNKNLDKRMRQKEKLSCQKSDQLYRRFKDYEEKKIKKMNKLRKENLLKESEEFTFTPNINSNKKEEKNIVERVDSILERRKEKINNLKMKTKLEKQYEIEKECTFRPKINYSRTTKKVGINLEERKKKREEKVFMEFIEKDKENCKFVPSISSKSRKLTEDRVFDLERRKVEDRLYGLSKKACETRRNTRTIVSQIPLKKGNKKRRKKNRKRERKEERSLINYSRTNSTGSVRNSVRRSRSQFKSPVRSASNSVFLKFENEEFQQNEQFILEEEKTQNNEEEVMQLNHDDLLSLNPLKERKNKYSSRLLESFKDLTNHMAILKPSQEFLPEKEDYGENYLMINGAKIFYEEKVISELVNMDSRKRLII